MRFETIQIGERGKVAEIILNRPTLGNKINIKMIDELEQALRTIEDESPAAALVIRGAGQAFCQGIDLSDFTPGAKPDAYGFAKWERVLLALERLPKITLTAVDGECRGGGMHLLLACDIRIATKRSFFQLHEAPDGFLPGMAVFRLAKFIGLGRARRLALTGRGLPAAEAERIGLIDHLCAEGALDQAVIAALDEFKDISPIASELTKRLLNESFSMSYEDYIGGFLAAQQRVVLTDAFQQRLRQKRGDQ